MFDLMSKSNGVGLAAPQVGVLLRLFVTAWGEVFINPEIEQSSPNITTAVEGCLSLPGLNLAIPRPDWVALRHGQRYEGLQARVIQHEMDHLNGRLIKDYL
jgi:peptide deformylase